MDTQALTIERASAMPAITWHFLKANEARIEIPEGLAVAPCVTVDVPLEMQGASDAFERALAAAQREWEEAHPAPTAEELAELKAFMDAEADATYGGTAQSTYQANADAVEEKRSLAAAFERGVGDEAGTFLDDVADERIVIATVDGQEIDAHVAIEAVSAGVSVAAIDVVAAPHSTVELSVVVDGCASAADDMADTNGIAGSTIRVFAGEGARVILIRTQTLDEGFVDLDDMALFAAADARIEVRQTVLGADQSFTGLAGDLRGDSSRVDVDTRYLGREDQVRDFNYALRHHGPKSKCNLLANGVLAGKSSKTLRGTIDLVRGCRGAEGSERETVLLVDEGVRNKTVPVILCNEDDVAGNHGATIGHIRDDQQFYLASRGLSQEAAERLFVSAVVEQAAIDAPDDTARTAVLRLGERVSPGFAELFED